MTWLETDAQAKARAGAFQDQLRILGRDEGRNLRIEYRWGGVTRDIVSTQTIELIDLCPDVIVTPRITLGPIEPQYVLCSQGQLL